MHPKKGLLRAYLDQGLSMTELKRLQDHLEKCRNCQTRLDSLKSQTNQVNAALAFMDARSPHLPSSRDTARSQLEILVSENLKKEHYVMQKMLSLLPRTAWIVLLVLILITASLFFAPVQAIANNILSLFRVEQVRVLEFNPDQIPEDLEASNQFEYMLSNNINIQERGEIQKIATQTQAEALAGFTVRLPQLKDGEETLMFQPGGNAEINIDIEQVRTVLADIGRSDIDLPDTLDGTKVTIEIPGGVIAHYGDCDFEIPLNPSDQVEIETVERRTPSDCTRFIQMPSPIVSAPPDMDVVRIGEAFLQITGMSREEASSFARTVDWTTTLIIPVPRNGTDHQEVMVDGVTGTFIQHYRYDEPDEYLLIWIKDGIVFALSGPGDKEKALEISGTIK